MAFILPTEADSALSSEFNANTLRWIEIEGLPYAFGNFDADATWFAGRAAVSQFKGITGALANIPQMFGGQIDPLNGGAVMAGNVQFQLVDINGLVTAMSNIATPQWALGADITAASTTPNIPGLSPAVGDLLYVGSETWEVLSTGPLTVRRGKFDSKAQDYGVGFPVGIQPYTHANRKVRYYQVIHRKLITPDDTMKFQRFAGQMKALSLGENRATFELRVDSLDKEIDRQAFAGGINITIENTNLAADPDKVTDEPGSDDDLWAAWQWQMFTQLQMITEDVSQMGLVNNQNIVFKLDDEFISCQVKSYGGGTLWGLLLTGRGLFGTRRADHKMPLKLREVLCVTEKSTATGAELDQKASFFTYNAAMPGRADHPLCILLSTMLSTGAGTAGIYDTLPKRWGMGVDASLVDIAGIETCIREDPNVRFRGYVKEPYNFLQFARELLRFYGAYFFINNSGKFTVKKLRPPLPESTMGYTSAANVDPYMIPKGRAPTWQANWESAVQQITFKYGWDGSDYKTISVFNILDANIYAKGSARTVSIESKVVGPNVGSEVGGVISAWDINAWLTQRVDYYRTRFGKPTPMVSIPVDYRGLVYEVGDIIQVNNQSLPNHIGGTRLGGNYFTGEIFGVQPDEASKTFTLLVWLLPFGNNPYRYYAPCHMGPHTAYDYNKTLCYLTGFEPDINLPWVDALNGTYLTQAGIEEPTLNMYYDLYDQQWNLIRRQVLLEAQGDGSFVANFDTSPDTTFSDGELFHGGTYILLPFNEAEDWDGMLYNKFGIYNWGTVDPSSHLFYPM